MNLLPHEWRRLPGKGFALGALVVLGASLVLFSGFGPDLPGPRFRVILGFADEVPKAEPCRPSAARIRVPSGPTPPGPRWRAEPSLPLPQIEARGTGVGGRIVFGGGQLRDASSSATLLSFDPATGRYRRAPRLPMRLDHPLVTAHRGDLYVLGGYSDGQPSKRMWRLPAGSPRWEKLPPMRLARGALSGGIVGDRLYAVGGAPQSYPNEYVRPYERAEAYSFKRRRWEAVPDMHTERHHFGATVLDGRLYVAGGRRTQDFTMREFERFDPATGRWERLPPLPRGLGGFELVKGRGEVIVAGGGEDEHWQKGRGWVTSAVHAYNPDHRRWRRLPNLRMPRHGHSAAVVGGRVYVLGGAPCPGFGLSRSVESLALG